MTLLFLGFIRSTAIHSSEREPNKVIKYTFQIYESEDMMELALTLHNRIRETHIDTESLTLARDLSVDAQEYAEQLRLVQTFLAQ